MNDLAEHYLVIVGQLVDQAAVGRLRVRLELADGSVAEGSPQPVEGAATLDETGYPALIELGDEVVPLEQVRRATIRHPEDR
jgi:hypothetical protein